MLERLEREYQKQHTPKTEEEKLLELYKIFQAIILLVIKEDEAVRNEIKEVISDEQSRKA